MAEKLHFKKYANRRLYDTEKSAYVTLEDVMQVIRQGRNGLELQFAKTAELLGDIEHWQHDTFIVRWRERSLNADAFLGFALDPDGKVRELRMEPISPLTDFSFNFQDLRLVPAR